MNWRTLSGILFCASAGAFILWFARSEALASAGVFLPALLMLPCCLAPVLFGRFVKNGGGCCGGKINSLRPESSPSKSK